MKGKCAREHLQESLDISILLQRKMGASKDAASTHGDNVLVTSSYKYYGMIPLP